MAADTPKGRPALFTAKLKSFVRDVTHHKRSYSQVLGKSPEPPVTPRQPWAIEQPSHVQALELAATPQQTCVVDKELPTEARELVVTPQQIWAIDEELSTGQPQGNSGISVQLLLSFENPLDFSINRWYTSSASFEPSERLLRGLLRRVDHGSFELITRKDPTASSPTRADGKLKPKRFEMTFQICQKDSPWATRTYRSYQKEQVTPEAVKEIVLSSNRLIGLFLRRHDPDFIWTDGPMQDESPDAPETSPYRGSSVQPMNCIPRSRFLEKTQSFESIPGFTVELSFTSRSPPREPPEWQKTIEMKSDQTTPLDLAVAESLFSDASYALEDALRVRRKKLEEEHRRDCEFVGGSCRHYEEDATEIKLRVMNNLGPQFSHLERSIHNQLILFSDPEAQECVDFLNGLETSLGHARDVADESISGTNDLNFRVIQLGGRGWKLDEPLVFTLGPSDIYSRRSVQAILDRVQAGVADTLRGNAVTVRMTAIKRGHFILDKTLVAKGKESTPSNSRWNTPTVRKAKVMNRLRLRIQQDIDMICKDTCSLDNLDDELPTVERAPEDTSSQSTFPDLASIIPLPQTPSTVADQAPTLSLPQSPLAETLCPRPIFTDAHGARESPDEARAISPATGDSSERGLAAKSSRSSKTSARVLPKMPTAGNPEALERFGTGPCDQEVKQQAAPDVAAGSTILQSDKVGVASKGEQYPSCAAIFPFKIKENVEHVIRSKRRGQEDFTENEQPVDDKSQARDMGTTNLPGHHERRTSATTVDLQKRGNDADEVSIAPSTPSLVFGAGHSARSSIFLFTPQIPAPSLGEELKPAMDQGAAEDDIDGQISNETVELDARQEFTRPRSTDLALPPSRFASLARTISTPSPLQREDFALSDDNLPHSADTAEDNTVIMDTGGGETPQRDSEPDDDHFEAEHRDSTARGATKLSSSILDVNPKNPVAEPQGPETKSGSGPSEQTMPMPISDILIATASTETPPATPLDRETGRSPNTGMDPSIDDTCALVVASPGELEPVDEPPTPTPADRGLRTPSEGFAQTAEEFDFSSPWTASPYNEDFGPPFDMNLDDNIDKDTPRDRTGNTNSRSLSPSASLVRPQFTGTRHSSFGSAGLLGFSRQAEPRLIGVGLRRAMTMGGGMFPTTTAMSFYDALNSKSFHHNNDILTRIPASSGQELDLAQRPASAAGTELGFTRASFEGSAVMKRSLSSDKLDDIVLAKRKDDEDKARERRRGRSGSTMFLIAGVTLASQIIRPTTG
ncbi:hypothetical protein BJ170DRAFT_685248 [Xylariales sp. AK1849]|nr:hypothetical protein BJ170DRAFT_685248 [Xylariales sp. AK1849]